MTTSTSDTEPVTGTQPALDIEIQDFKIPELHLASDNPQPDASTESVDSVSASIRMASYRLAAVFGELRWVNPDAA